MLNYVYIVVMKQRFKVLYNSRALYFVASPSERGGGGFAVLSRPNFYSADFSEVAVWEAGEYYLTEDGGGGGGGGGGRRGATEELAQELQVVSS